MRRIPPARRVQPRLLPLEPRLVLSAATGAAEVSTYHNNNARTGATTTETTLTPSNVGASTFGKLGSVTLDGYVYAQPLYESQVRMRDGRVHNVLFVATEGDTVYALDADNPAGGPRGNGILWRNSFVNPRHGITTVPGQDVGVGDIVPVIGITGTPVIDRSSGTLYVVTKVKVQPRRGGPQYVQQLHALSLATGREKAGGPTTIGRTTLNADGTFTNDTRFRVPGTGAGASNGQVAFNALRENARAGLALDPSVPGHPGGVVFVSFASHGDIDPYHGWLIGFDARTLRPYTVYNTTPDGNFGAIWQSGAAPSVDANGDLLVTTGNGTVDPASHGAGAQAIGQPGDGLGSAGLARSVAVPFALTIPTAGISSTGLVFGGAYDTANPVAPSVYQRLTGTGIDFNAGAVDPNGPHTFRATLTYDGSTLSESIVDQSTGATYQRSYPNVNIPAAVGGNTAYVGLAGSTDGRQATVAVQGWTYSAGGQAVVSHAGGFVEAVDLSANGTAVYSGAVAQLTTGMGEQAGTLFATRPADVRSFTTTFTFRFQPNTEGQAPGDGLSFVLQNDPGRSGAGRDFGQSVLRLRPTPGTMTVVSSFTQFDYIYRDINDLDIGSTATLLLPDFPGTAHPHEAIVADKAGMAYLLDRDALGGYNPGGPDLVLQEFRVNTDGVWGSPAYLNGRVYYQGSGDVLKSFALALDPATNTVLASSAPVSQGTISSDYPGTTPSASSDGTSNGIVWTEQVDAYASGGPGILRAYDANDLTRVLYDSTTAGPRDTPGGGVKFATPTVANGRVYVGAQYEVDYYGLLSTETGS